MPFRNFTLLGEKLIEEWAHESGFRSNRLITTLEDFVCGGPATRVAPSTPGYAIVEVYLTPPRSVLRSVPDAGALLLVDRQARTLEIIEVIDAYFEANDQDWLDCVRRAEQALKNHKQDV